MNARTLSLSLLFMLFTPRLDERSMIWLANKRVFAEAPRSCLCATSLLLCQKLWFLGSFGSVLDRLRCVLADFLMVASRLYTNDHFKALCVWHRRPRSGREMGPFVQDAEPPVVEEHDTEENARRSKTQGISGSIPPIAALRSAPKGLGLFWLKISDEAWNLSYKASTFYAKNSLLKGKESEYCHHLSILEEDFEMERNTQDLEGSKLVVATAIPSNLIGYETWYIIQGLRMNGLEAVWIDRTRLKACDAPQGTRIFLTPL
ncbi:hypothetical protein Tco_1378977 [Tanacetum coccineum]